MLDNEFSYCTRVLCEQGFFGSIGSSYRLFFMQSKSGTNRKLTGKQNTIKIRLFKVI